MPAGLFWADGVSGDDDLLALTANALGHAPALRRFLGPVVDQARIAQRLDDAAKVAGRVAHDLDNVFQGVTGFNALALELLGPESLAHQNLKEADGAARQGMKFCAQLHQLSRGGHARPLPAGVAAALAREVGRAVATFPAVRFELEASPDLPPVAVEGSGLQLLLGHLLDNAAEASPKDGAVRVTARLVELAPGELAGFLGCPATGPHVEVRIADAGPGLTDDARRRMFVEPFFTTKFRHRGLSLAVVYRMLYAHRGGVQVDSRPGQGTTMRVVLPLAAARVPAVEPGRSTGGSVS
jgi:signal transduction histidine kinase